MHDKLITDTMAAFGFERRTWTLTTLRETLRTLPDHRRLRILAAINRGESEIVRNNIPLAIRLREVADLLDEIAREGEFDFE